MDQRLKGKTIQRNRRNKKQNNPIKADLYTPLLKSGEKNKTQFLSVFLEKREENKLLLVIQNVDVLEP